MAHADYHCCALCDRKMDYASGGFATARTKKDLCTKCQKGLHQQGVMAYDGSDLQDWIEESAPEEVASVFISLGYRMCHYNNPVDDAFCEKTGIERERGSTLTAGMIDSSDALDNEAISV